MPACLPGPPEGRLFAADVGSVTVDEVPGDRLVDVAAAACGLERNLRARCEHDQTHPNIGVDVLRFEALGGDGQTLVTEMRASEDALAVLEVPGSPSSALSTT